MKIFVASQNPVKINAVAMAASETYPDAEVIGISVDSGVRLTNDRIKKR
jgi:non-canonical (house-cleaning) NTP pyrophosphatase